MIHIVRVDLVEELSKVNHWERKDIIAIVQQSLDTCLSLVGSEEFIDQVEATIRVTFLNIEHVADDR